MIEKWCTDKESEEKLKWYGSYGAWNVIITSWAPQVLILLLAKFQGRKIRAM